MRTGVRQGSVSGAQQRLAGNPKSDVAGSSTLKEFSDHLQAPVGGLVFSRLPIPQRAGIDSHTFRHLPLGKAAFSAACCEAFRKSAGGRCRIVAEEPNDGGNVADHWGRCVAFPVRNRGSVDTDLFRRVSLEQFEVQPAGANMVA